MNDQLGLSSSTDIAIVGIVAQLPVASSVETYSQNLRDGVKSICHLYVGELTDADEVPRLMNRPDYAPAADQALADIVWALKEGRSAFERPSVLVAETRADAARQLQENNPRRMFLHVALDNPDEAFMFPGEGVQRTANTTPTYFKATE